MFYKKHSELVTGLGVGGIYTGKGHWIQPLSISLPFSDSHSYEMETLPSSSTHGFEKSVGSTSTSTNINSILSFRHLSYQVKPSRRGPSNPALLVDDVSVDVRAGELLAIMVSCTSSCPM